MSAYLAAPLRLAGHLNLLAHLHAWTIVAGIGIAGVITIGILRGPVMTDKFLSTFGNLAGKVGPKIFYAAIGVLVIGIFTSQVAMIIIGASVAGSLLLGLLAWHY